MKNKVRRFINKFGYTGILSLVLYPVFLPFLMIKDSSASIFSILVSLVKYDWKYLSGNDIANAYNNLFYYIQDFNIQKFGRYGRSNLLAGGDFNLKNWFHTTPFSLHLQSHFGTTFIMCFAMIFWSISWLILYYDNINLPLILGIVVFSTLFFAVFIEIQNYNIIGWMLYPFLLFFIFEADYLLMSFVLLIISISSFTAFFIATIIILLLAITCLDYYLVLALFPGAIKLLIPIVVSIKEGALSKVLGVIGGRPKVKYSRLEQKKISLNKIYTLGLLIQFLLFYVGYFGLSNVALLLLIVVCLFIINEFLFRFGDEQSFYLAYLSVSVFSLLQVKEIDIVIYVSFSLSIYQVYGLILNVSPKGKSFISPGIRKPFNTKTTIEGLMKVFEQVPAKSKLLIAYKNPQKKYSNLFNGYRVFNEPIQYAATLKEISLFPDWYMVYENNKESDDESYWVENEEQAKEYMVKNKIVYILLPSFFQEKWNVCFHLIDSYQFEIQSKKGQSNLEYFLYKLN